MGLFSKLFSSAEGPDAAALIAAGALLIDARSEAEFAGGHLAGAVNIPHDRIQTGVKALDLDPSRSIVVYCQSGARSAMAVTALKRMGRATVVNAGGIEKAKRTLS